MTLAFGITYDYRCPFARNAHDHVVEGLLAGADWAVTFVPFSLGQVHVAEGQPDIWQTPERDTGLLALQASVVVRDQHPDRFLAVHRGLFDARHRDGRHIEDPDVVADVLHRADVDPAAVLEAVAGGGPLDAVRKDHEAAVAEFDVWGVPTFLSGDRAVFVRLMHPADGDTELARRSIERVIDLLDGWPDLNEFKHTTRAR